MGIRGVTDVVSKVGHMFDIGGGQKDAVDILKDDHRKVENLFGQFERARTASSKQQILDQLIQELTVHAAVEESLVYPLLEDSRKAGEKTKEAYEEHHVVKMTISELMNISADKEIAKTKVKVLREMVRHHVKEEEQNILPQLKKNGVDTERLAMDIMRRKQQLMRRKPVTKAVKSTNSTKSATPAKSAKSAAVRKRSSTRKKGTVSRGRASTGVKRKKAS